MHFLKPAAVLAVALATFGMAAPIASDVGAARVERAAHSIFVRYDGDTEDDFKKRYNGDTEDEFKKRYDGDTEDDFKKKRYDGDTEDEIKKRYDGDTEDDF